MTDTVTISREALEKAKAAKQKLLARHMKVLAELSKDPFFAYSIDHDLSRELLEAAVAIDRLTAALSSPPPPSGLREALVVTEQAKRFIHGNESVFGGHPEYDQGWQGACDHIAEQLRLAFPEALR